VEAHQSEDYILLAYHKCINLSAYTIMENSEIIEPVPGPQIFDYKDTTIITQKIMSNVIQLNGQDLAQLIQSLSDRINTLENKPPTV